MDKIIFVTILGYLTGLISYIGGAAFTFATARLSNRFYGSVLGLSAGILIAFTCFGMLPEAFKESNILIGIAGLLIGIAASTYLEGRLIFLNPQSDIESPNTQRNLGLFILAGVLLHGIPEGIAVGSMLATDFSAGLTMILIIILHSIPESFSYLGPLKKSNVSTTNIIILCFFMSILEGICFCIGVLICDISPIFTSLSMSIAGGILIYITCGEVIPQSKSLGGGRLPTIMSALGFVLGIAITA